LSADEAILHALNRLAYGPRLGCGASAADGIGENGSSSR